MKSFKQRLNDAFRERDLAYAISHMLVRGDTQFVTDELLQGDIDLSDEVLFEHIESIRRRTPDSVW